VIGVIDARAGHHDSNYQFDWRLYARLGVRAVLVAHPEGFKEMNWERIGALETGMAGSLPVNFPRLAASPEIFEHLGETVRLDVRAHWRNQPVTTLIGVLRGTGKSGEALLMPSPYEGVGLLPDRAMGALEALQAAYLIQMAEGLGPLAGSFDRDLILVAHGGTYNASEGLNHLLRIARINYTSSVEGQHSYRERPLVRKREQNQEQMRQVAAASEQVTAPGFLEDPSAPGRIRELPSEVRGVLDEQADYIVRTLSIELSEEALTERIILERAGRTPDPDDPAYLRFRSVREKNTQVNNASGIPLATLLEHSMDLLEPMGFREKLVERIQTLHEFHAGEEARLAQELAIAGLLDRYRQFAVFTPYFAPDPGGNERETMIFTPPDNQITAAAREKYSLYERVADDAGLSVDPLDRQTWSSLRTLFGDYLDPVIESWWSIKGYESFSFANTGRNEAFRHRADPLVHDWMTHTDSLENSFRAVAGYLALIAEGAGRIRPQLVREYLIKSYKGRVTASGVGQSVVPTYPEAGALVAGRGKERGMSHSFPGHQRHPLLLADPYGRFDVPESSADFGVRWRIHAGGYAPVAATFDSYGRIRRIKDEGSEGQRLFKSMNIPWGGSMPEVTLVTFRAAPVAIFDLNNPQTLSDYNSVRMITAEGMTDFPRELRFQDEGVELFFLEPDQRFYALFLSGDPANENVQRPRAFAMNVEKPGKQEPRNEFDFPGYLVADTPMLDRVPHRTAASMLRINSSRLEQQNHFNMADEWVNLYHDRAREFAEAAAEESLPRAEAEKLARNSVVYSTLNHPVLRESITEAVWGILWYLFLMVPFIFFFEKLLFCFSDTRKQITAQVGIFLVCFTLLRILHPAFEMVRSSLMILLGFVILLISGGITFLFSGKFKENLEDLRKKSGKVSAAEINTFGVMGSAFMLGLNNMHRRKVRTGLTCGTLVLLTFVMISFTSVEYNLVDENVALGRADYQGLLIRKQDFQPSSPREVFALRSKFGDEYTVAVRSMLVAESLPAGGGGGQDFQELQLHATDDRGVSRQVSARSYLTFDPWEPLQDRIKFLTRSGWFTEEDLRQSPVPVLLPDRLAFSLGLTPESVDAGEATVNIGGTSYPVRGIFESDSLERLRDLNGMDLLPFDLSLVADFTRFSGGLLVGESEPRVAADRIVIFPNTSLNLGTPGMTEVISSVAVSMPEASFREASDTIEEYLIQTGVPVYYGLDGIAYRGQRTRSVSLAGLVDLLIPLLIAGLTVLNTMKGSVYERRDEIFVYNAVGIAPKYIFFMFIAEAFVYAVVGSVLGYILSQGVGRVLTVLELTGGLRMTYTSLSTIYASWTLMAAVFISTWFPARQAMEIATPSDEGGWTLPDPEKDILSFDLPFTFRHRERYAVLSFFRRYLGEHGEGGAGRFHAGAAEFTWRANPGLADDMLPGIRATIWLKPFDLGVSQQITIDMPVDEETGNYKGRIRIERISGTRESWIRLNHGFIRLLRRQFLYWRAVPESDRDEMFEETRETLKSQLNRINLENEFSPGAPPTP
jgi:hypothetical protein